MTRLLTFVFALLATMTLTLPEAEAKKFGGGKSMGTQYQSFSKPATPPAAAAARPQAGSAAAAQAPRASGASRWLGPLAGLAAGGLLASLFFGDAFEGFQMMDFLLIALLAVGGVMLFKAMRRGAAPRPAPAGYRGASPVGQGTGDSGDAGFSGAETQVPQGHMPTWLDLNGFVQGAKGHFVRLQAAWDRNDLAEIREYVSPDLLAALEAERATLGETNQTEVLMLQAEPHGVRREGDRVVVSVRFSGMMREDAGAEAQDFSEVWHVAHPWESAQGDWIITGIQQEGR